MSIRRISRDLLLNLCHWPFLSTLLANLFQMNLKQIFHEKSIALCSWISSDFKTFLFDFFNCSYLILKFPSWLLIYPPDYHSSNYSMKYLCIFLHNSTITVTLIHHLTINTKVFRACWPQIHSVPSYKGISSLLTHSQRYLKGISSLLTHS